MKAFLFPGQGSQKEHMGKDSMFIWRKLVIPYLQQYLLHYVRLKKKTNYMVISCWLVLVLASLGVVVLLR